MNLALLGTDDDVLALATAAVAGGHAITWIGDVRPEDATRLAAVVPGVLPESNWESLLGQAVADAVIVGRGTASLDLHTEQLKRLVADAMPLLVVHPAHQSVLLYYELDMGRGEIHSVLRHYNPLIGSPTVAELAACVQTGESEIGTVHQIVCERFAADWGRNAMLQHLARDAELLGAIAADIRSTSAIGPRPDDTNYASLQAQMTSTGPATVRWSVTPTTSPESYAEVTLLGAAGARTVRLPAEDWDAPRAAIDAFVNSVPANGTAESETASTWQDATAAMEVVDAIQLSLEKGRTIEVHQQRLTEQLAFRGTMSAFGCGLLVLAFLVMVVVGVMGGMETLVEHKLAGFWAIGLLLLLGFFLLLQLVPWLATKRPPRDGDNAKPS